MKEALVIHPRFYLYGGGELICLHTIKALQELGYRVSLFSDVADIATIQRIFDVGKVLRDCHLIHILQDDIRARPGGLPEPSIPALVAFQRLRYMKKAIPLLEATNAEVIFGTQPSVHFVPGMRIFQFLYDINQLGVVDFYYKSFDSSKGWFREPYYQLLRIYRNSVIEKRPHRWFMALSRGILNDLTRLGYENSSVILPPCRNSFHPMPKKKQVIMVTRVVPEKRLETFIRIASLLPQYLFILMGRESPDFPGYKDKLLANAPRNLQYVEAPLTKRPELLQESKVYLHTGRERGFGIAIAESLSAGCFPICYSGGDGAEVVRESGVGSIFDTVEAAVEQIKEALEDDGIRAQDISERAKEFGPDVFESRIKATVDELG